MRSKAAPFNVTPARYGVSKPGGPTFLSCGRLACCRSKKKICCPAEDRFVIVNCQWRSNEGPWGDGRCCFAGAGAGCLCTQPVFGDKGREAGNIPTSTGPVTVVALFALHPSVTKSLAGDALSAGSAPHVLLVPAKSHQLHHVLWRAMTPRFRLSTHPPSPFCYCLGTCLA